MTMDVEKNSNGGIYNIIKKFALQSFFHCPEIFFILKQLPYNYVTKNILYKFKKI